MVDHPFRVIDGGNKPKAWRKKETGSESEQVICPVCNGSMFTSVLSAPHRTGSKISGGVKRLVCAHCLMSGKITEIN